MEIQTVDQKFLESITDINAFSEMKFNEIIYSPFDAYKPRLKFKKRKHPTKYNMKSIKIFH